MYKLFNVYFFLIIFKRDYIWWWMNKIVKHTERERERKDLYWDDTESKHTNYKRILTLSCLLVCSKVYFDLTGLGFYILHLLLVSVCVCYRMVCAFISTTTKKNSKHMCA